MLRNGFILLRFIILLKRTVDGVTGKGYLHEMSKYTVELNHLNKARRSFAFENTPSRIDTVHLT